MRRFFITIIFFVIIVDLNAQLNLDSSWYYIKIDLTKSESFLQKGYKQAIAKHDTLSLSQYYFILSKIYDIKAEYQKSLSAAFVGEKLAEQIGSSYWVAKNRARLAGIYFNLSNIPEAKKQLDVAIVNWRITKQDSSCLAGIYELYKIISSNEKNYVVAIEFAKKEQQIAFLTHNTSQYYYGFRYLSNVYQYLNKSHEEQQCVDSLRANYLKITPREQAAVVLRIAEYLTHQGKFNEAFFYIKEFEKNAYTKKSPELQVDYLNTLSEIYQEKKDFNKAFGYAQMAYHIRDSLLNTHHIERIAEMEADYKLKDKELEIQTLQLSNLQKDKQRQQLIIYAFIITAGLLVFFAFTYVYKKRRELKIKETELLLENEKQTIKNILFEQSKKIEEENYRLSTFLKDKISKEIHDGLSNSIAHARFAINSLALKATNSEQQKQLEEVENIVANLYTEARNFSHQLKNNINASPYNIIDFLNQIEKSFKNSQRFKIKLETNINELNDMLSNEQQQQLHYVLKEAIVNVMKHTQATLLVVNVKIENSSCYFSISDNGTADLVDIKEGIGLSSMKERMQSIGGTLSLSRKGNVTVIEGEFVL